jgi:serine/threonine protein kinase
MQRSELPTQRVASTRNTAARGRGLTAGMPQLVLGRYRVQRRLGAGGFGTVWQARDERLERDVAIKILPRERIVGGRFEREARAAARLSHPGIVTLFEAVVDDDGAYLVSELVRGATLDHLLTDGRLSDRDVLEVGIALCDALEHAHARGIVHRDVKPSNVLVPEQQAINAPPAKLTDFGVARVVGGDSLTRTGDVIGTAAYMSPEQAEGLEAGAPADLYSLALVIYEGLTGVNPVRTGTAAQRTRRLGAHLPPLRRQRRDLPRELGQGIDLALRPRARERGTIPELRRALEASLGRVDDVTGVVASPWPTEAPRRIRTRGPTGTEDFERQQPGFEQARQADQSEEAAPDAERAESEPRPRDPWPARAAAAAGTALVTGWLAAHVLTPSPVAPAAAAVLAAGVTLALPRIGWALTVLSFAIATIAQHHSGAALLIVVGGLAPAVLLPRKGTLWPLPAGAPALATVSLAGAWPALAGRAATPLRRGVLGAVGWLWLVLAAELAGATSYVHPETPAPSHWMGSASATVHLVVTPLIHSGLLAPAVVWAAAAIVLPWIVRARSPVLDLIRVTIWAATVASATAALVKPATLIGSRAAVLGALASALVALVPTILAAWWRRRYADSRTGLP